MPKTAKGLLIFSLIILFGLGVAHIAGQGGTRVGSLSVFMICAIWAFGVNWAAFIPAALYKTEKYYDLIGAFTNSTIILIAAALSQPLSIRGMIVTLFVTLWAVRLGVFLFRRISRDGGDKRFDVIKRSPIRFLNAWTLQALWTLLTTACAVAIVTSGQDKPLEMWAYIGIILWIVGFSLEVIADRQKRTFRQNPANQGQFITRGLWAWSRHPNYFGEIVLWIGVAVMAVPVLSGGQWISLISPVFVILLLTRVSGIPMLETSADKKWGESDAYQSYKANTPVLIPRPPR